MSVLSDIFSEYINKRNKGFEAPEALNMLKGYIKDLPKEERQKLAELIRKWEHKHHLRHAPIYADVDTTSSQTTEMPQVDARRTQIVEALSDEDLKRMSPRRTQETGKVRQNPPPKKLTTTTVRVLKSLNPFSKDELPKTDPLYKENRRQCPNCQYGNQADAVICYSCGTMLGIIGTRQLEGEDDFAFHHFGRNSVLVLKLRDEGYEFEMMPQLVNRDLVVGRSAEGSTMVPDVDLLDYGGERNGVSRLHLSVKYDSGENAIQIYDMGSSNGTFLNGQRLHPREVRLLRNGDELRLGRLVTRALFRHSTQELKP